MLGGGIGSLAAAAFMIRDGGFSGSNISILELPATGVVDVILIALKPLLNVNFFS